MKQPYLDPESRWAQEALRMTNAQIIDHLGIAEALIVTWLAPADLFTQTNVNTKKLIEAAAVLHTLREVMKLLPTEINNR